MSTERTTGPAGGPVAIVTGAAGGMGSAIARRLATGGMTVVGLDRAAAQDCHRSEVLDVADQRAVRSAIDGIIAEFGPIDALVSTAGHYRSVPFTDVSDEDLRTMLRVHLGGFFAASQAVLPGMLARGQGSIVAIASELAVGGGARDSHYAAAKGAVLGAVRSLAAEVADAGVRVNAVAPGPTNTPMLAQDSPWREPGYLRTLPTRALAEPEEVALCVDFLVRSGGFMTGEVLNPNSGAVI
ncbi:SDR family oxidoreductase [Leucobacter rhizosphaerae]|uniref:SDR family oxidoreductase n=1 Tax=Leucobacter rhizosphaerae TaxID=2932245 RepID=A0ABY4FV04_9MICO|nr:SDR family oxidoreductase [Leucobacter rhizosphaerae]UOQ60138.1 SDR family oxidoreductase [Leucobacter rhizosphaerae]